MRGVLSAIAGVFQKRLRGFRVIDLGALGVLLVLICGVYAFKAGAGQEGGRIKDVDQSIAEETRAIRLLRADVARLEAPGRLERLSTSYLGLQTEDPRRETEADRLGQLVPPPAPPAAPPAVPPPNTPFATPAPVVPAASEPAR